MFDHALGRATGSATRADDAAGPTPGKSTQVAAADPAPAADRPSAFDGAQWEDIEHDHEHAAHDAADAQAATAASAGGGGIHIITRAGLRHLRQGGAKSRAAARELYDNPNAYIVLKAGQSMPKGYQAKATILFPSYAEFHAAHAAGRIPHDTQAVVYDNEHWDQTPRDEKTNAVHYARLFGELAHRLGLELIAAPTQKWFAADARFADIIDLQLQSREVQATKYSRAVKHDVALAHEENNNIEVVAQISSNRNHLDPSHSGNLGPGIQKAEGDILNNQDELDGFWGYLYQRNEPSVKAGQKILTDLASHEEPATAATKK